jgi:hypothetical protein
MMSTKSCFLSWAAWGLLVASSFAATPYQFSILENKSGFSGKAGFEASTTGTLIGNYDAAKNPGGTRTKPGLFGSFGSTENLPVDVELNPSLGGDLDSSTSGSFAMDFDKGGGSVTISKYDVNLLSTGPVKFPANIELVNDTFRTRNPDSFYLGGIPLTIPLGSAELSSLTATQFGGSSTGLLTPNSAGGYNFSVGFLVQLSGEFTSPFGSVAIPGLPLPFILQGTVHFMGKGAMIQSLSTINFNPSVTPAIALPQLPLGLPTILPPGQTANVLFDLTLQQIAGVVSGQQTLVASGELVPEPNIALGTVLLLLFARRLKRN